MDVVRLLFYRYYNREKKKSTLGRRSRLCFAAVNLYRMPLEPVYPFGRHSTECGLVVFKKQKQGQKRWFDRWFSSKRPSLYFTMGFDFLKLGVPSPSIHRTPRENKKMVPVAKHKEIRGLQQQKLRSLLFFPRNLVINPFPKTTPKAHKKLP